MILVYGAGVLGSLYAAKMHAAGKAITILARGQRLAQIRDHGIVLEDATTGERTVAQVPAVERLQPGDAYDWILVLVRKNQLAAVLPALQENHGTPNILFMSNTAAGPAELIAAAGRERTVLGFAGAGGERVGPVVRYTILNGQSQPTSLGELDGAESARVCALAEAFRAAGFPTVIRPTMDAWYKTHIALVSPIALAIYMAGGNNYRLAQSAAGLMEVLCGIREGFRVLRALGVPITPSNLAVFETAPDAEMLQDLHRLLNTPRAELTMARHANAARDEAQFLADEFFALTRASGVPTPALDRLYRFLDPATPPAI